MRQTKPQRRRVKRSVYTFLLLSYIAVLLITLSSSFVFFGRINRQITEKNNLSKQLQLSAAVDKWTLNTQEMERLANVLAFDAKLEQYANGLPGYDARDFIPQIASVRGEDKNYTLDSFIYNINTDEVLTATMKTGAKTFFEHMVVFDGWRFEALREEVLLNSYFQQYLPVIPVSYYGETRNVMPYVLTYPVSTLRAVQGQVVVLIDADAQTEALTQLALTTGAFAYMLDEDGGVLLQSENAPALDAALQNAILNGGEAKGYVTMAQPAGRGQVLALVTPLGLYRAENRSFLLWMLGVTTAYLIVGLVIVRLLARYNYRPIQELAGMVQPDAALAPHENELDAIKGSILAHRHDRQQLNELLDNQRPYVVREVISQLLTGTAQSYDAAVKSLAAAGVAFPTEDFVVASLEIDETAPFFDEGMREESILLSRLIAQNVGCELFEASFSCHFIEHGPGHCVFLLARKDGLALADAQKAAHTAAEALTGFAAQYRLAFYVGLSGVRKGYAGIPLAYDEARKAAEHSRLWAVAVTEFGTLEDLDWDYYYPAETEQKLISYLRTGDYGHAKALLATIFETNAAQKHIGVNAARGLIVQLHSTLARELARLHPHANPVPDFSAVLKAPSLEQAQQELTGMVDYISRQHSESRNKNKTEKLADAVAEYIRSHVEDAGLDLNLLSREFGMTPQYISGIFKRYKNENIKDYISRLRLERAKELLRTTDMPVKDIARQLGYAGEIGIIRLFKRYESTTPGEYRSLHKE